ncbi:MAG: PHP domain-containing protein [Bdellovibrionales bacterium]|nr:PHP domain-containing protein [Bdellovibrionales bacterium]
MADFHLHSTYSDGVLSIRELVDLMGKTGHGAIAITDHLCEYKTFLGKSAHLLSKSLGKDNFQDYLDEIAYEKERAWNVYRMVVIPGVEITKNSFSHKNSAHILALDIREYINPDLNILDVIHSIKAQGGLAIAAHPVYTGEIESQTYRLWDHREELADHIDAWEVASGKKLFNEVLMSGLPIIANSDLHKPSQVESWKTHVHGDREVGSIKRAIRQQDFTLKYFPLAQESLIPNGLPAFSRQLR